MRKTLEKRVESNEIFKTVFIEKAESRRQLFERFRCIKYGFTSVKFEEASGHSVSSRNDVMIAKVHERLTADLRTSSTDVAWEKENLAQER